MKATGIIRNLDTLGRVVLPKELRDLYALRHKTPMEIFVEGNSIVLRKYETECIFCGSTENLIRYKNKLICRDCIHNL